MFCTLSLKPRDLRRLIKDSEVDPIVSRAPIERFIKFDLFIVIITETLILYFATYNGNLTLKDSYNWLA